MPDPTTNALADLARAIGVRPRLTKEERAARRAARQAIAVQGTISARAERNRKLGIPRPSPGTQMLVRCVPTVKNRRRCGIDFGPQDPISFQVSTWSRSECERRRSLGEAVVSEDEAEQLLADAMLIAMPIAAGGGPDLLAKREAELAAKEADLAKREVELADAKAAEAAKAKALEDAKAKAAADEAAKAAKDAELAKAKAAETKDEKKDKPKG
jgi:hypothetical protein